MHVSVIGSKSEQQSVADLHTKVSSARPPPPTGPNSFAFTYVFTKKHLCQRLAPPPMRVGAPQREILDPPLTVDYKTFVRIV